jgi:transcriptional regulator with XRE-family HTH domain
MTFDRSVHARPTAFARHLRTWRRQRGFSQLELSLRAGVSQRHISFLETGRSRPRAEVIHRIAEALDLPLRERNVILVAAGINPAYPELPLRAPPVAPFRQAVDRLLEGHEPFPGIAVDRWWDIVATNRAARRLLRVDIEQSVNALDLFFGPNSLRQSIENFAEVAPTFLVRLRREVAEAGPDERLAALLERAEGLVRGLEPIVSEADDAGDLVICPRFIVGDQVVHTVSMVARFGSAREVTLDELRVELIFPADAAAEAFFRSYATI